MHKQAAAPGRHLPLNTRACILLHTNQQHFLPLHSARIIFSESDTLLEASLYAWTLGGFHGGMPLPLVSGTVICLDSRGRRSALVEPKKGARPDGVCFIVPSNVLYNFTCVWHVFWLFFSIPLLSLPHSFLFYHSRSFRSCRCRKILVFFRILLYDQTAFVFVSLSAKTVCTDGD